VRLILDGGPCEIGVESTVLSLDPAGAATLLRPGAIPPEAIEKVLGEPLQRPGESPVLKGVSPGMLESHYAPVRPMVLLPSALAARDGEGEAALTRALSPSVRKVGLLVFSGSAAAAERRVARLTGREVVARSLSRTGDLEEAARRLFAELRFLDSSGSQLLFAEPCPRKSGLGHAIEDRLRRASAVPR
jgi:L-threonylcarbamoyladenylate synthase